MSPALVSLSAMGDALDMIEASPAPVAPKRHRRRDDLINAAPLVIVYMLAAWADGWASAPLIPAHAG